LLKDAGRRSLMEAAGLRRARELSLDSMLDRYESLLETLSHAHAGSIAST